MMALGGTARRLDEAKGHDMVGGSYRSSLGRNVDYTSAGTKRQPVSFEGRFVKAPKVWPKASAHFITGLSGFAV
jgi:hypothetical protein